MAVNVTISTAGIQGAAGTDGSDGSGSSGSASSIVLFDDFISNTAVGNIGWTSSSVSGGVASIVASESNHQGILSLSTGASSSSAYSNLFLGTNTLYLGNGILTLEFLIRFPTLASDVEDYIVRFGLGDSVNDDHDDGIWLEYNRSNSLYWLMCVNDAGTATKTASTAIVAENTWIKLKIIVNAAADTITYYVNGSSIGTKTSGYSLSGFSPRLGILKTVGSSARILNMDYFSMNYALTTER